MKKTLFNQWREKAYDLSMPQKELEDFWNKFSQEEKKCYKKLLGIKTFPILGTVEHFVEMFDVDIITFIGFLAGLNSCLKIPNNLETITMETIITLDYDADLLYEYMVNSNYDLSIWNNSEYYKNNVNKLEVVNKILSSKDKKLFYYFIYKHDLSSVKSIVNKYCNCDDIELQNICNLYVDKYSKDPEIMKANQEARELLNKPHCPICNSTNLSKISTVKKATKIGVFGIFGAGDVGKTYKCNNCGSRF